MKDSRRIISCFLWLVIGLSLGYWLPRQKAIITTATESLGSITQTNQSGTSDGLSENARAVLAWLRVGLPAEAFRVPMTSYSTTDLQRIEALTAAEFPLLMPAADPPRQRLLMERWAEVDAPGLIALITPYARRYEPSKLFMVMGGRVMPQGSPLFRAGLAALRRVDPEGATKLNQNLKGEGSVWGSVLYSPTADGLRLRALFGTPQSSRNEPPPPDPDFTAMSGREAWKWLKAKNRIQQLEQIVDKLQKTDPAQAVAFVEDLPMSYDRQRWLRSALLAAAKSPEALFGLLDKFATHEDLAYALKSCQGLRDHFKQFSGWAQQSKDPASRRVVYQWLADHVGLSSAASWLAEIPRGPDRWSALEVLAARSPDSATMARQILEEAPTTSETQVLEIVVGNWAGQDREGAVSWARSLTTLHLRNQALTGAWKSWASQDLPAAQAASAELTGEDRLAALRGIAGRSGWAGNYPEQVLQWINSLPPTEQVASYAAAFGARQHNSISPPGGLTKLSEIATLPVDTQDWPALESIARYLIRSDLNAATPWALQLPSGRLRREAISTIANEKLRFSADDASKWIEALPSVDRNSLDE